MHSNETDQASKADRRKPLDARTATRATSPLTLDVLQSTMGNAAVSRMLSGAGRTVQRSAGTEALRSPGRPLDPELRGEMARRPASYASPSVQRARLRGSAPAPMDTVAPSDLVSAIKERSKFMERWVSDFDLTFAKVTDALDTTIEVTKGGDLLQMSQEMIVKYTEVTNNNPDGGLHLRTLNYALGGSEPAPGIGGFSTMSMSGTELVGRPGFARVTAKALAVAPGQHRRHYIAWHNIRSLLNRSYAAHPRLLIPYLQNKLDRGQVHPDMKDESDKSVERMSRAEFGTGDRAAGETLMRAAYVMNSSQNNLWVGNGSENSEINSLSRSLQGRLRDLTAFQLPVWKADLENNPTGSPQAQRAKHNLLTRMNADLRALAGANTANTARIMAAFRDFTVDTVIRSLETDDPADRNHPAAQADGIAVGNAVFDAVFSDSTPLDFQVVRRAVDFLWTSS